MKLTKTIRGRNLNVILTVADDFERNDHYKVEKATYRMKDYPGDGIILHWDGQQLDMWVLEESALYKALVKDEVKSCTGKPTILSPNIIAIPVIEQNYLKELRKRMSQAGDVEYRKASDDLTIFFDLDGNIRRIENDGDTIYKNKVIYRSSALSSLIGEIIDYSLKKILVYSKKTEHGVYIFRMTIGELKEVYENHTADKVSLLEKAKAINERMKEDLELKVSKGVGLSEKRK